ncbi:MAG: DUF664 domain-containing protein [Chloroflexi bacterium]|nr:DUF664 domain-containing protein [Chloroflexota bacterium]
MTDWNQLAHFLYGRGFWYANPLAEVRGLTEEQLYWTPHPNALCALWHVGHIAHRERTHIGRFLQGLSGEIIPSRYEVFGPEWASPDQVRASIDAVADVYEWVRTVREASHAYIASLREEGWSAIPPQSDGELSVAHWVFITAAHTALHIGRIQMLRALIEGEKERAC